MRVLSSVLVLLAMTPHAVRADDGAASIAAGGVVLMKRETRIVMAKEVLSISPSKVLVEYDFRNDSDEDITTEVAFPIPDYVDDPDGRESKLAGFDDFKLWVNGALTKYAVETRAFTKRGDVTKLLAGYGIDAATFGHEVYDDKAGKAINDLRRLSAVQKNRLVRMEAIYTSEDLSPIWSVRKKYHWTQTFPAHSVVHIRHQYTPVLGNSNTIGDPSVYRGKEAVWEYSQCCPAPALRNSLEKIWNKPRGQDDVSPLWISYVSFILTTANTWKTPIEDFTLIVERPHDPKYKTYISFCWDGPVTQVDADHFPAHVTGLVPKKELMIGYIHAELK